MTETTRAFTVRIDPEVIKATKIAAAQTDRSVPKTVEDALRKLYGPKPAKKENAA